MVNKGARGITNEVRLVRNRLEIGGRAAIPGDLVLRQGAIRFPRPAFAFINRKKPITLHDKKFATLHI